MIDFDEQLKYDLITNYYTVSVSNKTIYTTKFNIDSTQISMMCGYNSRNKLRWVSLADKSGNILLPQTFLKHKKRCELNFNADLKGLDYYLTLKRKDQTKKIVDNYDYLNWADDFDLLFVGGAYSLKTRLESNHRKMVVGN